jgi:hypothetical protein
MGAMRLLRALLLLTVGLALGCGNPQPRLIAVEPAWAGSDSDVRLTLLGHDFIPATLLDPLSGRRVAQSDGFEARIGKAGQWESLIRLDWLSPVALAASLPSASAQRLPAGPLDVEVTDPRGRTSRLADGFQELGPDRAGPRLALTGPPPDTLVAAGMILRGGFQASDSPPGTLADLGWSHAENGRTVDSARCPVPAGAEHARCTFQLTLGKTLVAGDVVRIVVDAADSSANRSETSLSFVARDRPILFAVSPSSGGTAGGTDIVISGAGFVAGSQAMLDDEPLFPNGGIVVNEHAMSGHAPAHAAGPALLVVHTPLGQAIGTATFTYLSPPTISTITPDRGPAAGGTAVAITGTDFNAGTRIYFGASLDGAAPLVDAFLQSDTAIVGRTPAGSGRTTVWAFDGTLGFSKLQDGFFWSAP